MHPSIELSFYLVLSIASTWYEKRFLASSKNAVPEIQKPVTTVHTTEASASPLYAPSATQYPDFGAPNLVLESFSGWTYLAAAVVLLLATIVLGLWLACVNVSKGTTTKTVKVLRDEGEIAVQGQPPLSLVDTDYNATLKASHIAHNSKGLTQDKKNIGWYTKKLLELADAVNVLVDEKIELQNWQKDLELALDRKNEDLSLSNNTSEQSQGEWRDREEMLKQEIERIQREAAKAIQAAIDSKKKAEESCQHVASLQDELDRRDKEHETHMEEMRNKIRMTNELHEESLKVVETQKFEIERMKELVDSSHRLINITFQDNTTLKENIKELEGNLGRLFEQLDRAEASRDLLRKEGETSKKKAEKDETRAATAETKIRSLKTELNRAKESGSTVHSQNTKLHNELASANKELNGVRNERDEIKQKGVKVRQELDRIKQELNNTKNELNGSKQDLANSRAMNDSLASQLSVSVAKIARIENDRDKAVEHLAEVKKSLEEANRTISQTQDGLGIVEKDKEISRLKTLLDDSSHVVSNQTDKDVEMDRLKEELTTVQRNANDHTSSLVKARQKITTLEAELKTREDQCNGYAHTNATYMNTVETMKKELEALSGEKEALLRTNRELKKQPPPMQHAQDRPTVAQYIAKANVVSPSQAAGETKAKGPQTSSTDLIVENHILKKDKRKLQQANQELLQKYKEIEEQLAKVKDEREKSSVENDNKMDAASSIEAENRTLQLENDLEVASKEILKTKEAFGNLEQNLKQSKLENSNLQQQVAQLKGQLAQLNYGDSKRSDTSEQGVENSSIQAPSPDRDVYSLGSEEPQSEVFEQAPTEAPRGRVKLQPRSRKTKIVAHKGTASGDVKPTATNEQSSWEDHQARDSMMVDEEERPLPSSPAPPDQDLFTTDGDLVAKKNTEEGLFRIQVLTKQLDDAFAVMEASNPVMNLENHQELIRSLEDPPTPLDNINRQTQELFNNPGFQTATERLVNREGTQSEGSETDEGAAEWYDNFMGTRP